MATTRASTQITGLNKADPGDLVFVIDNVELRCSGRISFVKALDIQQKQIAFRKSLGDLMNGEGSEEDYVAASLALVDTLFGIFKEKTPKLEELPGDVEAISRIASMIAARCLGADEDDLQRMASNEGDAESRPPRRTRRAATKSTSPRG